MGNKIAAKEKESLDCGNGNRESQNIHLQNPMVPFILMSIFVYYFRCVTRETLYFGQR